MFVGLGKVLFFQTSSCLVSGIGIDHRFVKHNKIEEISIGDYVISGGEIASFILIDACVRLIPEVLGNRNSLISESFQNQLIEYPQYTKPRIVQHIMKNESEIARTTFAIHN